MKQTPGNAISINWLKEKTPPSHSTIAISDLRQLGQLANDNHLDVATLFPGVTLGEKGEITKLNLSNRPITTLEAIGSLGALRDLKVMRCRSLSSLRGLERLTHLRQFHGDECAFNAQGLTSLAFWTELRSVELGGNKSLQSLDFINSRHVDLLNLNAEACDLDDVALNYLAALRLPVLKGPLFYSNKRVSKEVENLCAETYK